MTDLITWISHEHGQYGSGQTNQNYEITQLSDGSDWILSVDGNFVKSSNDIEEVIRIARGVEVIALIRSGYELSGILTTDLYRARSLSITDKNELTVFEPDKANVMHDQIVSVEAMLEKIETELAKRGASLTAQPA